MATGFLTIFLAHQRHVENGFVVERLCSEGLRGISCIICGNVRDIPTTCPWFCVRFSPSNSHRYGLVIAAVQLDLRHTLVKSIVVSSTESTVKEGWLFVDKLSDEDVCDVDSWSKNPRMPIVLHYCHGYHLGKFFFSKYRLKKKYISCDAPLLTMPPKGVHKKYQYWERPPPDMGFSHEMEVKNISFVVAKREAFMLCGLISAVNEAARYFKSQHCNGTGNFAEIYNFHDDPYS
jgi:hypothetical protein